MPSSHLNHLVMGDTEWPKNLIGLYKENDIFIAAISSHIW